MIFINDLARSHEGLSPAPIGVLEDGWADILADLINHIGAAVATRSGTTVDVITVEEPDEELLFDAVVDGAVRNAALCRAPRRALSLWRGPEQG